MPSLNPICFSENFLLLVCEFFRAHELRSQLEVTEVLEPSFQRNTLLHRRCGLYAWKWDLESVLVMVGHLNPGVRVLGFLITMPRKETTWW